MTSNQTPVTGPIYFVSNVVAFSLYNTPWGTRGISYGHFEQSQQKQWGRAPRTSPLECPKRSAISNNNNRDHGAAVSVFSSRPQDRARAHRTSPISPLATTPPPDADLQKWKKLTDQRRRLAEQRVRLEERLYLATSSSTTPPATPSTAVSSPEEERSCSSLVSVSTASSTAHSEATPQSATRLTVVAATTRLVQDQTFKTPCGRSYYRYTGPVAENEQGQVLPHGYGEIRYANGQVYHGQVCFGHRHGHGECTWPDGQVYRGPWSEDQRSGDHGVHRWPDGRSVIGSWSGGHLEGHVLMHFASGAVYDGECRGGKRHGRGTHTWPDGKVYTGQYVDGRESGHGILRQERQGRLSTYRGQFRHGQRHGFGRQVWPSKTYDGEWVDNAPHGRGRLQYQCGHHYTGCFSEGKFAGHGIWETRESKFVGQWKSGYKEGPGKEDFADGGHYSGGYHKGRRHGYGRFLEASGRLYTGGWESGRRSGCGIQLAADGRVEHCGLWNKDEPVPGTDTKTPLDDSIVRSVDDVDATMPSMLIMPSPSMPDEVDFAYDEEHSENYLQTLFFEF